MTLCRNNLHDLTAPEAVRPDGRCRECRLALRRRFNDSEKGVARMRRHRATAKYRATRAAYERARRERLKGRK
jgi:hypothetical protein